MNLQRIGPLREVFRQDVRRYVLIADRAKETSNGRPSFRYALFRVILRVGRGVDLFFGEAFFEDVSQSHSDSAAFGMPHSFG